MPRLDSDASVRRVLTNLSKIDKTNSDLVITVDEHSSSLEGCLSNLRLNNTAINALQFAVTAIGGAGSSTSSVLTNINTSISNLQSLSNSNVSSLNSNTTSIANLQTAVAGLSNSYSVGDSKITNLTSSVSVLQTSVTSQSSALLSNSSAISSLQMQGTSNANGISTNTTSITSLNSQLTTVNSNVSGNSSAITALQTSSATNTSSINSLNTNVNSLQTTTNTNSSSIATLQTNVSSNSASITSAQNTIATHTSQISSLQTSTTSNSNSISTLQSTVSTNSTDITNLKLASPVRWILRYTVSDNVTYASTGTAATINAGIKIPSSSHTTTFNNGNGSLMTLNTNGMFTTVTSGVYEYEYAFFFKQTNNTMTNIASGVIFGVTNTVEDMKFSAAVAFNNVYVVKGKITCYMDTGITFGPYVAMDQSLYLFNSGLMSSYTSIRRLM